MQEKYLGSKKLSLNSKLKLILADYIMIIRRALKLEL